MSSRAQSTWLFGPVSDVFLGAGLLYLLAIFGMTVSGFAVHESMSPATVAILITIFSGTHYGTTLLRVYEHEAERRTYRVFTVYATVAMIAALGGALYSPIAGSLLITIYLTWSPWHYTGQNYGISMMFLRRRGVDVTPRIKSWLHASFILSYVSVFLNFHFEGGISQTDPLGYTSGATSGFQFIGLGLPAVLRTWLLPAVGLGYVVTTFGSIAMLLRGSTLKAVSPALVLLATQAAWFAVPHLSLYFDLDNHIPALNLKGDRNFQAYFLWAALGHAIQYLWITTYYARSDQRWQGYGSFFTKAFVFGNAVWAAPVILFAPDVLGRPDFDFGLSLCVAAAVNLHHFVLDGAIWKLRNPKVAAVLLRNEASESAVAAPRNTNMWIRRVAWVSASVFCIAKLVSIIEIDTRLPAALADRDYASAEGILDRAGLYGRDSSTLRADVANRLIKERQQLAAIPHYWRSLELQPQADGYRQLGILLELSQGTEQALRAWQQGLASFPEDLGLLRFAGNGLVKLRRYDDAVSLLEHANAIEPGDGDTEKALAKARARSKR